MDASVILAVVAGLVGSGGVLFAALRYNREETARIVAVQAELVTEMQAIYETGRKERVELANEVARLRVVVRGLEMRIAGYQQQVSDLQARLPS